MCFSAESSFVLAAALVPAAAFSVARARRMGPGWLPLAIFPAAFAVQQAAEGLLWLDIAQGDADGAALSSRGFLFFSHFFWPLWAPLAVWAAEPDPRRRRLVSWIAALGALFGASIAFPAIALRDWLSVEVVHVSIEYHTTLIWDGVLGRTPLRVIYAALILAAFFLSTHRALQAFGALILAAVVVTLLGWPHAFISVWCFFAAALSLYVAGFFALRRA
jgi:hypothetical protein